MRVSIADMLWKENVEFIMTSARFQVTFGAICNLDLPNFLFILDLKVILFSFVVEQPLETILLRITDKWYLFITRSCVGALDCFASVLPELNKEKHPLPCNGRELNHAAKSILHTYKKNHENQICKTPTYYLKNKVLNSNGHIVT